MKRIMSAIAYRQHILKQMLTKNKKHSRIFCSQKKNRLYHWWLLATRAVGLSGGAISFLPLFRLYFIERYKVKSLLEYVGLRKIWWILTK